MRIKKLLLITLSLVLAFTVLPALAERGDDANRASKNGETAGTIDGVEVVIEYGRPKVKGRTIWGGLVPYGKVWRTGADEATTIELSGDVTVEGEKLPAGTYSLFTIPGESEWTVIFNQVAEQWGAYSYDSGKDALRVTVTPQSHDSVEELEFVIEGGNVVLHWGEVAVPIALAAG